MIVDILVIAIIFEYVTMEKDNLNSLLNIKKEM